MFLFHVIPFLVCALILRLFKLTGNWWNQRTFWTYLFFGFGLLAFRRSFYGFETLLAPLPPYIYYYVLSCAKFLTGLMLLGLPLLAHHRLMSQRPYHYYGLRKTGFIIGPYLALLLLAWALVFLGSFVGDLQAFYPRYARSGAAFLLNAVPQTSEWSLVGIYEMAYASNFIAVEIFFRGFLIFAFSRVLGAQIVMPMVATYCFLHFGKPLTEAISSIFGGYLLGIFAYYSRNIWGGILLHVGVAWAMELAGWLQGP